MDYQAIISAIISGVLSIAAVTAFLVKVMPKITGWIALAKDAVETISDISKALSPDSTGKVELTADEINQVKQDAINFRTQLSVLLGK